MRCVTITLHVVQGLWFSKDIEKKPLPISEWVDSSFVCFVLWFVWGVFCQMFSFLFFVCTSLLLKFSDFLYLLLIFYKDFIVSSDSIRFYNDQRTTTLHREWPVLRSAKRSPTKQYLWRHFLLFSRRTFAGARFAERSTGLLKPKTLSLNPAVFFKIYDVQLWQNIPIFYSKYLT